MGTVHNMAALCHGSKEHQARCTQLALGNHWHLRPNAVRHWLQKRSPHGYLIKLLHTGSLATRVSIQEHPQHDRDHCLLVHLSHRRSTVERHTHNGEHATGVDMRTGGSRAAVPPFDARKPSGPFVFESRQVIMAPRCILTGPLYLKPPQDSHVATKAPQERGVPARH